MLVTEARPLLVGDSAPEALESGHFPTRGGVLVRLWRIAMKKPVWQGGDQHRAQLVPAAGQDQKPSTPSELELGGRGKGSRKASGNRSRGGENQGQR